MAPKTTLWDIEDHTVGKHKVLEAYLKAWLPIILKPFDRATFVDGFAGPGEYAGGERGSPRVAIDTFRKHRSRLQMRGSLDFMFIEKDEDRANHLNDLISSKYSGLRNFCDVKVCTGEFSKEMSELLDTLEARQRQREPLFVMG